MRVVFAIFDREKREILYVPHTYMAAHEKPCIYKTPQKASQMLGKLKKESQYKHRILGLETILISKRRYYDLFK